MRINGKVTSIGLGKYPLVAMAEARQAAFENRRAIAKGKDPRGGGTPTFAEAAEKVIEVYAKGWKDRGRTASKWRSQFQLNVYPHLGKKQVDQITSAEVLAALVPIWHTKAEIARKSRQRISAVMRWAIAEGYRSDNSAGDAIAGALVATPTQNAESIWTNGPNAWRKTRRQPGVEGPSTTYSDPNPPDQTLQPSQHLRAINLDIPS